MGHMVYMYYMYVMFLKSALHVHVHGRYVNLIAQSKCESPLCLYSMCKWNNSHCNDCKLSAGFRPPIPDNFNPDTALFRSSISGACNEGRSFIRIALIFLSVSVSITTRAYGTCKYSVQDEIHAQCTFTYTVQVQCVHVHIVNMYKHFLSKFQMYKWACTCTYTIVNVHQMYMYIKNIADYNNTWKESVLHCPMYCVMTHSN